MPADLKRLHKYMLDIERIDHISDEIRAVVESEWPEPTHKLPPKHAGFNTSMSHRSSAPTRCLWKRPPHACGAVRNVCCAVSAPRGTVFKLSAAPLPPPKPAIACRR